MRRLSLRALRAAGLGALTTLTLIAGCASAGNPPGGPERHTPPQIVKITPDSGETNVNIRNFEITFDEVVSDRPAASGATELNQIFLISPRDGDPYVSWHRDHIDVRPRKGFRANQTYRVTMLPGLADLRNNIKKDGISVVFSTGPDFPTLGIVGRLFDWETQKPVNGGYIEAMLLSDTTLVYVTATDTLGGFEVGPLGPGRYRVRGLIDQNTNRVVDRGEKWDTTTIAVTDARPSTELLAIERDTIAPNFSRIVVDDSVTLHVTFDRPIAPKLGLQPELFTIQRADSVALDITAVQWGTAYDRAKQIADSLRADSTARAAARAKADSARARADTTRLQPPPAPPIPPAPTRGAPPPPKPHLPAPDRVIVIKVSPKTLFVVGNSYRISTRAVPNLLGYTRPISRVFEVPKPPPRDTIRRTPRDTTRRPPVPPAKPPARPPAKPPLGLLLR